MQQRNPDERIAAETPATGPWATRGGGGRRLAVLLLLILVVAAFFLLDLGAYLDLDYLKASHDRLLDLYHRHPLAVLAAYAGIYIVATALSLPGAAVLTLAGGAVFGLALGTVVVSFASTIGATLACAVARFLLRDWVLQRFGDRLAVVDAGMERDGPLYLLSLRLVPIFPFFVINLVMGLTTMPLRTYYWVSQLGMLPATMVYVNAGSQLARIDSLGGILSPSLLLSFALLGIFPLLTKKIITVVQAKREGAQKTH